MLRRKRRRTKRRINVRIRAKTPYFLFILPHSFPSLTHLRSLQHPLSDTDGVLGGPARNILDLVGVHQLLVQGQVLILCKNCRVQLMADEWMYESQFLLCSRTYPPPCRIRSLPPFVPWSLDPFYTLSSYLSKTSWDTSAEMSRRGFPMPKRVPGIVEVAVVGMEIPSGREGLGSEGAK